MRFPGKSAPAATASAGSSKHGNGSTFPFGVLAAMLVCAAAFLGIGAPAASAAPEAQPGFVFKNQTASGELAGGPGPINPIAFVGGGTIAYANFNLQQISLFSTDGSGGTSPLVSFATPGLLPADVAADPGDGTVYAQDPGYERAAIYRYVSDGAPTPTYTRDTSFEVPSGKGIKVDASDHTLLVAGGEAGAIYRYDTSGALAATLETPGFAPNFIALAADGSIWTASSDGTVKHLSAAGAALGGFSSGFSPESLGVDPATGRILIVGSGKLHLYTSAGSLLSESSANGSNFGPIFGADNLLYTAEGGAINVYGPAVVPGVQAPLVSEIAGHGAHVEAEVDPGEGEPGDAPAESRVYFEYSSNGGLTWQETADQELTDPGVQTVETDLTGLLADSDYLVRVVATNTGGGVKNTSASTPFTTANIAPEAEATGASGLGETVATLNGTINANGSQTTYHFEYGVTTSYGSRVPATDAPAGDQRISRSFSNSIAGLTPGTIYHYRVVAENASGESVSEDSTFVTATPGEFPARAFEMVTPVDKRGAQIKNDEHYLAAPGGSAFVVNAAYGASDANSSPMRASYIMWRGADGWSDWVNTDLPLWGEEGAWEMSTVAISEDFEHALVISNRALTPEATDFAGNIYVRDLRTDALTFVGSVSNFASLGTIGKPGTIFAAGAPDFSWLLLWLEGDGKLVPGTTDRELYRWTPEDGVTLESRLPDGSAPTFPQYAVSNLGRVAEYPIATPDGSIVAFDLNKYFGGGTYIRKEGQSIPISVSQVPGDTSEVRQGSLDYLSSDGRYVFFSSLKLTEDAPELNPSPNEERDLYRYDTETGDLIYITQLTYTPRSEQIVGAGKDGQTVYIETEGGTVVWHEGQLANVTPAGLGSGTTFVTDNGRYLGWASQPDDEAYLFDLETGKTVCVSCPTSGTSLGGAGFVNGNYGMSNRSSRGILEDGTMFFTTKNPLLPADHNTKQDVYSYKNGHLTLISPGNADFDARFIDASKDGTDVYFETDQGILPQDTDGALDVYDARVGGGFPLPPAEPKCGGEGCRGSAVAAPAAPEIGSKGGRQSAGPAIAKLKPLTARDKRLLAKGKKVNLKVRVTGAGKVKLTGTSSVGQVIKAQKQAKQPGTLSVPIKLSKKGLMALNRKGTLTINLTVSLGDRGQKESSFTLRSAGGKKGGSS